MANAFTKAQFMEAPSGVSGPVPLGAVKAGAGITISADGTISTTASGGTVSDIVVSNGIQGGGQGPQVFLALLPPTGTELGGVKTLPGSGISIDSAGIIRTESQVQITGGLGVQVSDLGGGSYSIALKPAGSSIPSNLGGVYVVGGLNGLIADTDGALRLAPANVTRLGGVKQGTGVTISPDGTLDATGSGGTITGVGAGTGLGGGGTTGAVTLFLRPAGFGGATNIGGVYAGDNIVIEADGRLSVSATSGVQTITKAPGSAIDLSGTATNPVIGVFLAGTLSTGVCRLYDGIDGTPPIQTASYSAATPTAVKTVADLANTKLPLAGGAMAGPITFTAGQVFPGTVDSGAFTQLGGILVGDTSPPGYAQLPVGANGLVLAANSAAPLGVEWVPVGTGTVTSVSGTAPIQVATGTTTPAISVSAASYAGAGVVQLEADPTSTSTATAPSSFALSVVNQVALNCLPKAGGTMTGDITFAPAQTFPGTLPLAGGTMTGDITFSGTQAFPGVVTSVGAGSGILVGGSATNPIVSATTATTAALGVVQPDGTTITINGSGVISSTGGMANPMTALGDIIYASTTGTPGTPSRLGIGAAGTILAVNAGLPAWRTSAQLGLLTTTAAATTYAPLDSPTFTGPVSVNGGGAAGANALTVSGGNLVLATSFTPASSSSTGSVGELAWDNTGYLYFCYAPNTWGRVQIDLTPF